MKTCTKCLQSKPTEQFSNSNKTKDGKTHWCKSCVSLNRKRLYKFDSAKEKERRKLYRGNSPYTALCQSLWMRTKRVPTENAITPKELYQKWVDQEGRCAITGVEMGWSGKKGRLISGMSEWDSISIDRVDQSIGYVKDNVRLVCFCINAFRGRMTDEEMFRVASLIAKKLS